MKRVLQMVMALSLVSSQLFAHQAAQISRASTSTTSEVTTTQEQTTAAVTAPVLPIQAEKKEKTFKERVIVFIKEHPYVTTAMAVAATAASCYGVKYVLDGRAVSADEKLIKDLEKQEADAKAGKAGVKALTKEDEKKLAEARERQEKRNLNVVQVKGTPAKGKSENNPSQVTPPAKGALVKGNSAKQLEQQRTGVASVLDTMLQGLDGHNDAISSQLDRTTAALNDPSPNNPNKTVNVTIDKANGQFMTQGEKPEVVGRNGRKVLKNKETGQLLLLAQLPWTAEQEQILKDQFDDVSAEYEQKPSVVNPGATAPAPTTAANVTPEGKPQEPSSSDDDSGIDSSDDDSSTSTSSRSSSDSTGSSSSSSDEDSDSTSSDEESAGRRRPTRKRVQQAAPSAVQAQRQQHLRNSRLN